MKLSEEQAQRYSRHFVLKEVGVSGQKKLLSSKVLVIGAGALGSSAIMYLAAAGVGTIGICDYDVVDLSNLQRQIIHKTDSVGKEKVVSAEQAVKALNPDVQAVLHRQRLTVDNIQSVIEPYDFILDCTDRFETKFLINDGCVLSKKPYCHAGVVSFGGQVMTYVPGLGPCLRCLLGGVPEDSVTCAEAGVLGAVTGVIGSIQATETIKYLLGIGQLLVGKVLRFDGLNAHMGVTNFAHSDPDCAVCGTNPTIKSLVDNRSDYEVKCALGDV